MLASHMGIGDLGTVFPDYASDSSQRLALF
jgi:hypothetical protein